MKSMITKDVINPAFLPPIKNLRTIHRVNPTTNEKTMVRKHLVMEFHEYYIEIK